MKILTIYGPYCLMDKRGFDFEHFLDDPRGQTGSEYGIARVSQELAKMGHDVTIATFGDVGRDWGGVRLIHYDQRGDEEYDCAVAWNEAGSLRATRAKAKACSLQINTVVGIPHGCEDPHGAADCWLCPSEPHKKRLEGSSPGSWHVVPDGVDLEYYPTGAKKVPGRVVWTSSPDRGLHWLLSMWPEIKRAVPWATLRVYYQLNIWLSHFRGRPMENGDPGYAEQARRAAYIEAAMGRMSKMGVGVVGAVSRNRLVGELRQAECLAYTADPVIWSEGYSCSLMEACAAEACPIATDCDAFPAIYGGTIPLVGLPLSKSSSEFSASVITALTDPEYRGRVNRRARALAEKNTWAQAAAKMAEVLESVVSSKQ